jgi:HEAT repeat protein
MQSDFPAHLQIMRGTVVEALGKAGGARTLQILHDALQDKDQLVVGKAAEGVGRLKDSTAIEALVQLAGRGGNVGQSAVEALAEVGDSRGVSTLQRLLRAEDPAVKAQAAYGLAKLKAKDEDGELELTNMITNERLENKDRLLAAYYLTRLGSRAGLEYLNSRLTTGPASSRSLAAQALGRARHPKAVPPLAEVALRSKDPSLRLVVAQSLGQIGGTRAVYTLRRMEDDDNKSVRAAVRQVLADMGEDL